MVWLWLLIFDAYDLNYEPWNSWSTPTSSVTFWYPTASSILAEWQQWLQPDAPFCGVAATIAVY
jgi:hypothetical protein